MVFSLVIIGGNMKRYILLTKSKSKYEDFFRYHFKLFENYFDLQKHLIKFWYVEKNTYVVFEETEITKDYSLSDVKKLW